jgi:hypothetical protein
MATDHEHNLAVELLFPGQVAKKEESPEKKQHWINFKTTKKEANMNFITLQTNPELKHIKFKMYKENNMNRQLNHNIGHGFKLDINKMSLAEMMIMKIGLETDKEDIQRMTHAPPGFLDEIKRKIDEILEDEEAPPPEPPKPTPE